MAQLEIGDDEDFGTLLGGVVAGGRRRGAGNWRRGGFAPADARVLAEYLQPGTALAFLLVEHHWAAPLFDIIAEAGGSLISDGFLTDETGQAMAAEVAALEDASRMVAEAQAVEAAAVLRAVAASEEAAQAEAAVRANPGGRRRGRGQRADRRRADRGSRRPRGGRGAGRSRPDRRRRRPVGRGRGRHHGGRRPGHHGLPGREPGHHQRRRRGRRGGVRRGRREAAGGLDDQVRGAGPPVPAPAGSRSPSSPTSWASPGRRRRSGRSACTSGSACTAAPRR